MSEKRILVVAFTLVLLTTMLIGVQLVNMVKANPGFIPGQAPAVVFQSPTQNKTYATNTLPLAFMVSTTDVFGHSYAVMGQYLLDRRFLGTFGNNSMSISVSDNLVGLSEGQHRIDVSAFSTSGNENPFTLYFSVDTTPPRISITQVDNRTYSTNDIPLSFTVSELSTLEYCLDGQPNVAVAGNTTLTGLSEGYHTIEIYASDSAGNVGNSDLVQFTVNSALSNPTPAITQNPNSSPSPTIEPTIEPTSTPKPQSGFLGTNLPTEYGYTILTVSVIAVVAAVSLLCLKRLRK